MDIYTDTVTCEFCGEEGVAKHGALGRQWIRGSFFSHSDPRVCAENLKKKQS